MGVLPRQAAITIDGIPTLLWGPSSAHILIAVHGLMSRKDDTVIAVLAEEAVAKGYQVLSFDLPEHGARAGEDCACTPTNGVRDLLRIASYAAGLAPTVSLFACSLGAYFGLRAVAPFKKAFFLSPMVDMQRLIAGMMAAAGVDEARLAAEKHIPMPQGPALDWDYYCDVKSHPITDWAVPTSILYGGRDALIPREIIATFAHRFGCDLRILEDAEHFFHTYEQIAGYRKWLGDVL